MDGEDEVDVKWSQGRGDFLHVKGLSSEYEGLRRDTDKRGEWHDTVGTPVQLSDYEDRRGCRGL